MKEFVKGLYERWSAPLKIILILVFGGMIGYRFYLLQMEAEQTSKQVDMSIRRQMIRSEARMDKLQNNYTVSPLVNRHYTSTLIEKIDEADDSIKVMMYLIQPSEENKDSRYGVDWILNHLRQALERGVEVQMLVGKNDHSSPYDAETHVSVLKRLHHEHFEGYVFPLKQSLHAKMVLIDEKSALLGAHNWTWHSLNQSHETSLLMEGEFRLKKLHHRFDQLFKESRKYYQRQGALY